MNKLKAFVKKPLHMIRLGLHQYEEQLHRESCKNKYGIERLPTLDLLELTGKEKGRVGPYTFLEGTSMVTDIFLLKSLAEKFSSCHYLEIGSWRGESISNVADVAESCVSVTLGEKDIIGLGLGKEFARNHGIFCEGRNNIKTVRANSHTFDFKSLEEKFDLIFIDGDHSYKGVLNDTKKTLELRKDHKSIIVWHDYGFSPETVRYSVLEAILDGIPKDKHRNLFHVSNTMCAVYMEDCKIKPDVISFPTLPDKKFFIDLHIERI